MATFKLSLSDFEFLLKTATRHHLKQIAEMGKMSAHTRRGLPYFKDRNGRMVSSQKLHQACDADPDLQRQIYSLYMHYNHFGS